MSSMSALPRSRAPIFDSGELPFPHFGDWMHEGHPSRQGHDSSLLTVAPNHDSAARNPRSAHPEPPGIASWMMMVGLAV